MKRSLENPDIYLAQKVCAFRSKCQKLVGEEEYMAYLKNGAQFGTRGTLSKYVRELKRSDKNVEALAWNKYNQAITRSGCALGTFVYSDMQITKENKELNSKLSEEEKQKSEALYQEIRNQYFESAAEKLGCG